MKILLAGVILVLLATPVIAQENPEENMVGLTCGQILAMKSDDWAEYYSSKTGNGSEATYDIAFETYAHCQSKRSDVAIASLSVPHKQSIRKYRQLYHEFRIAATFLQQAYAGGGTLYTHLARRAAISDEDLVEKLIQLKRQPQPKKNVTKKEIIAKINLVRSRIRSQDPALRENRQQLSTDSDKQSAIADYAKMKQSFDMLVPILLKERGDISLTILQFVDDHIQPIS